MSTHFPTRPMDVAALTAPEFTYELEWNDSPAFERCESGGRLAHSLSCAPRVVGLRWDGAVADRRGRHAA
jgi:hypothetical protein